MLCGDFLETDAAYFFSMQTGCERNVSIGLGKYRVAGDTFYISPFDFKTEEPFLQVSRKRSGNKEQTIHFLSADKKAIRGLDSSWVVTGFRRKKQELFDFSEKGIVRVRRGRFEGIELM